jgi:predicted AAA+ superfamily ATPase
VRQPVIGFADRSTILLLMESGAQRLSKCIWSGNVVKRLTKRPKVYVRDSGLVHALLGLPTAEQILSNMISGPSWEGFAVENILSAVPTGTRSYYYRTGAGAEIDLVLDFSSSAASLRDRAKPWAVEIKRSSTPSVSKGFHNGCDDIQAKRKLVVYPGKGSFIAWVRRLKRSGSWISF